MKLDPPSNKPFPASAAAQPVSAKSGQGAGATANSNAPAPSAVSAGAHANAAAVGRHQSAGVAVTVSTLARTLGASPRANAADVDTEKVDAIRSAIEQKTYKVNAEAIADRLLSNAEELLSRHRRV